MDWFVLSLFSVGDLGIGGGVSVVVIGATVATGYTIGTQWGGFHWPTITLAQADTCGEACLQWKVRGQELESAEQAAAAAMSRADRLFWAWAALAAVAVALFALAAATASTPGGGLAAAILFGLAIAALITAAYSFGVYLAALADFNRLVQAANDARTHQADARAAVVAQCSATEAANCLGGPAPPPSGGGGGGGGGPHRQPK